MSLAADIFDKSAPSLLAALTRSDEIARARITCSGGDAQESQAQFLPGKQVPFSQTVSDLHGPTKPGEISDSITFSSAPAAQTFTISREDDAARALCIVMDRPPIVLQDAAGAAGASAMWKPVSDCIEYIDVVVGDVVVERIRSEQIRLAEAISREPGFDGRNNDGYAGHTAEERTIMIARAKKFDRAFVKIPFGIMKQPFALAAMEDHSFQVAIKARPLANCCQYYDAGALVDCSSPLAGEELMVGVRKYAAAAAGDADLVKASDYNCSQLLFAPALDTVVLCKAESDMLMQVSQAQPYVNHFQCFPFLESITGSFASSQTAQMVELAKDSSLWSSTPIVKMILVVKAAAAADYPLSGDVFESIEFHSNSRRALVWHPGFLASQMGARSRQQVAREFEGGLVYELSFESLSEGEKAKEDMESGLLAISASTHPLLKAVVVAGAPACTFTLHRVVTNSYQLHSGTFSLGTSYA